MKQRHILVIDDEVDILGMVKFNLDRQGFAVTAVSDPEEGIRIAAKGKFDLILLDLGFPKCDGIDVLQRLRHFDNAGARPVPVIVVSARADEAEIRVALGLGASDYVTKPFSPGVLVAHVKSILRLAHGDIEANPPVSFSPVFFNRQFNAREKSCFVLMPFGQPWSGRLWKHLLALIEGAGFDCKRADMTYGPDVLEDIWTSICESSVVVADLSGCNPNVMYEMGIVHTVGRPSVLLTQTVDKLPFDFRRYRVLSYEDNTDGFQRLATELPIYLEKAIAERKREPKVSGGSE
jgi:CheY-like chemotaxis protein